VPQPILPPASRPSAVLPSGTNAFALPPGFHLRPSALGQRLPEPVQQKMEAVFKTSFADVRVHIGNEASSIGALAFTHGNDLYFAPGQYNPQTPHGQRLLGHELAHVVQQRAARVRNPLGAGIAVVQDPGLEAEAERMVQRVGYTHHSIQAKHLGFVQPRAAALPTRVIQCGVWQEGGAHAVAIPEEAKSLANWIVQNYDGLSNHRIKNFRQIAIGPNLKWVYNRYVDRPWVGGDVFNNQSQPDNNRLPLAAAYTEWDFPGDPEYNHVGSRGRERLVIGDDKSKYYTNDHYDNFTQFE